MQDFNVIEREEFTALFGVLLEWGRQTDQTGVIERSYWRAISQCSPTSAEVLQAIEICMAASQPGRLIPHDEIRACIRDERKRNQPQLSAVEEVPPIQDIAAFRLTIAACVLKAQKTETKFYRSLLTPKPSVMGVELPGSGLAITHQQVLDFLEKGSLREPHEVLTATGFRRQSPAR